ncbi:MAG: hypothetical protein ACHQD9_03085 [Chitinophagales bacterium]
MLFLAVFCGFLAENFREHQLDKQREVVYMQNMYEDLKSDTAIYSNYVATTTSFLNKIDSLEMLMNSPDRNSQLNKIYFVARTASMLTISVFPNQRTFDQMKDAGNLRLISNRQVADSVSTYYNSLKAMSYQDLLSKDRLTDYMGAMSKVCDAQILFKILKERKVPPLDSCKLITTDPLAINELLVKAQYFYGSRLIQKNRVISALNSSKSLLELIKKEYHFQ